MLLGGAGSNGLTNNTGASFNMNSQKVTGLAIDSGTGDALSRGQSTCSSLAGAAASCSTDATNLTSQGLRP
jgi:hypothetical protein